MVAVPCLLLLITVNALRQHNTWLNWGCVIVVVAFEVPIELQVGAWAGQLWFCLIYISRWLVVHHTCTSILHASRVAGWLICFVRRLSRPLGALIRLLSSSTQDLKEVIILFYYIIWSLLSNPEAIPTHLIFVLRISPLLVLVPDGGTCGPVL